MVRKSFGKSIFVIVGLLLLTGFIKAQPATFDMISYTAQIEPDVTGKSVKGKVTVLLSALTNNLSQIGLNAGALEIDAVREGRTSLNYEKSAELLKIDLPRPAKLSEKRAIEIVYHGAPKYGIEFYQSPEQTYTVFSTSQWMPCVDAPNDRATFRLNLIIPKGWAVVGNGRLIRQFALPDGKISSIWEERNPVPTYLFGFAAEQFRDVWETYKNIQLRYLAPASFSESELKQIFRATPDMLDFYENKAGMKYTGSVYTQVVAQGGAEQEMAGFTALNEQYARGALKNEQDIWLGAHEFAHQWWGNSVTNRDWTHFWLNEGITNFMTAAYLEHRFGRAKYLAQIEEYRAAYEKVRVAGKDKSLVFPNWNKPTREDRRLVYDKGAYVMHLLREQLGDAIFWKAFKDYTRQYWGKSVTTIEFQKAMERSSGQNLASFFDKWVYLKS